MWRGSIWYTEPTQISDELLGREEAAGPGTTLWEQGPARRLKTIYMYIHLFFPYRNTIWKHNKKWSRFPSILWYILRNDIGFSYTLFFSKFSIIWQCFDKKPILTLFIFVFVAPWGNFSEITSGLYHLDIYISKRL